MADDLIALFGKITTTDHEQLTGQFSRVLQVPEQIATFFLEASNWNVEMAVHNYLAAHQRGGQSLMPLTSPPMAAFIGDLTPWQTQPFLPGTRLPVRLRFMNNGTAPWPMDTHLTFVDGDRMDGKQGIPVSASAGETIEILLILISPLTEGTAMGSWRLACGQGYFGDTIYLIITSSLNAIPVEFPEFQGINTPDLAALNLSSVRGPHPHEFGSPTFGDGDNEMADDEL